MWRSRSLSCCCDWRVRKVFLMHPIVLFPVVGFGFDSRVIHSWHWWLLVIPLVVRLQNLFGM